MTAEKIPCRHCHDGFLVVEVIDLPEAFPVRERILKCLICSHEQSPVRDRLRKEHEKEVGKQGRKGKASKYD